MTLKRQTESSTSSLTPPNISTPLRVIPLFLLAVMLSAAVVVAGGGNREGGVESSARCDCPLSPGRSSNARTSTPSYRAPALLPWAVTSVVSDDSVILYDSSRRSVSGHVFDTEIVAIGCDRRLVLWT